MHVMYVGPVGAGKTFNAVAEAVKDAGDTIVTNTDMDSGRVMEWLRQKPKIFNTVFGRADGEIREVDKRIITWDDFSNEVVRDARCGVLLIDEAPLWLDARKYDSLSPDARRKIIEHRKDDLLIVSTAQDVAFIDKVFRLLCDEIRLVKSFPFPFIAWFVPTARRPTIVCKDCARVRRDGAGDDRGWKKWFGCATVYSWTTYRAIDLIEAQDTSGDSEQLEPKAIGRGWRLFDTRIAACYETSMKLSHKAAHALESRPKKWSQSKIMGDVKAWGDKKQVRDVDNMVKRGDI